MADAIPVHHPTLRPPEPKQDEKPTEQAPEKPAKAPKVRDLMPGEIPERGVPYRLPNGTIRVDH